ncbi:DegT/DnrJ/EryC1/StrS family aminotransferase [Streptomyces sp. NPDC058284]|uniref:DegT/DnrJ/EryC1/StrS family aminotransferase n=1 Tax=unclassified Streptomyces TaxID=2593676 RepID=UPI0036659304
MNTPQTPAPQTPAPQTPAAQTPASAAQAQAAASRAPASAAGQAPASAAQAALSPAAAGQAPAAQAGAGEAPVPLVRASLGEAELAAVAEVFASGWPAGQGPRGTALEAQLAQRYDRHAVALANCGAALHVALLALGVRAGDEVIVADYTFPAPAHAVRYLDAVPVFADVRPDTHTVDPQAVADLIGPRTVGIIAVDTVGLPADYRELRALAERHHLFLIEDAACAVGATYQGQQAGALAEVACLSFHGRKGATSGEGGALLAADPALAADARRRSSFGIGSIFDQSQIVGLPIPEFTEIGYNFKLSDIAAAILQVQLTRIGELLERRTAVAEQYAQLLADEELLTLPQVPADRTHAWQSYLVRLDERVDRAALAADLRGQGIGCGHGTWASHLQPVFEAKQSCPVSADLFARHLAIPMHAELSTAQIERVAGRLRTALHTHMAPARARKGTA